MEIKKILNFKANTIKLYISKEIIPCSIYLLTGDDC